MGYVPKPFTDEPGNPSLTDQIREVLRKVQDYKDKELLPCPQSSQSADHTPVPIATIDLAVQRCRTNVQKYVLFNGEEHPVSYREYDILQQYADAQAEIRR